MGFRSGNSCWPTPPPRALPRPPGPLCRVCGALSPPQLLGQPAFSTAAPLQDIQASTGFAPPCLCASQQPAQREAVPLSPLLRDGWGPAGARGPLTPSDKAPSGSDLQPALRARPGPSPAPLRSKTGKLKSPRSRTWRRRPRSPPCFRAAGWTRPSGCRGLLSKAPCTPGTGALGRFTAWNPPTRSPFQTVSSGK